MKSIIKKQILKQKNKWKLINRNIKISKKVNKISKIILEVAIKEIV